MRVSTILVRTAFALLLAVYLIVLMTRPPARPEFEFERYEGFLGLGRPDDELARADFQKAFPPGTSLGTFREFFDAIGGKCFELRLDYPGQLLCGYEKPINFLLSLLPIRRTWSVRIHYDPATNISTQTDLISGMDGP